MKQASLFPELLQEQRIPTHDWLTEARALARELGKNGAEVTVWDVRRRMPPPDHIDPRTLGAIFKTDEWTVVRRIEGTKDQSKRSVAVFQLKDFRR